MLFPLTQQWRLREYALGCFPPRHLAHPFSQALGYGERFRKRVTHIESATRRDIDLYRTRYLNQQRFPLRAIEGNVSRKAARARDVCFIVPSADIEVCRRLASRVVESFHLHTGRERLDERRETKLTASYLEQENKKPFSHFEIQYSSDVGKKSVAG